MRLLPKLNAVWRVPLILLATAVLASLSVAFSLIDGSGRLQHGCARLWSRFIFFVSRVKVDVYGLENIDPRRGYVFMANHLSMFDHWAFLTFLPCSFRFAAKASLFRIPFLGWHLKRAGNVAVDRHHPRRTLEAFKAAGAKVRQGISFVIYPEGARTWGEEILPFKRGPFLLAKKAQAPIVPVTFVGAHRRLARGSMVIYPGRMEMHIHPPLEYDQYQNMKLEELAARVRAIIARNYRQVNS